MRFKDRFRGRLNKDNYQLVYLPVELSIYFISFFKRETCGIRK